MVSAARFVAEADFEFFFDLLVFFEVFLLDFALSLEIHKTRTYVCKTKWPQHANRRTHTHLEVFRPALSFADSAFAPSASFTFRCPVLFDLDFEVEDPLLLLRFDLDLDFDSDFDLDLCVSFSGSFVVEGLRLDFLRLLLLLLELLPALLRDLDLPLSPEGALPLLLAGGLLDDDVRSAGILLADFTSVSELDQTSQAEAATHGSIRME